MNVRLDEVATASLGFAIVGFLAAFLSYDLRLAAIVGPSLFTLGAAAGHITSRCWEAPRRPQESTSTKRQV